MSEGVSSCTAWAFFIARPKKNIHIHMFIPPSMYIEYCFSLSNKACRVGGGNAVDVLFVCLFSLSECAGGEDICANFAKRPSVVRALSAS